MSSSSSSRDPVSEDVEVLDQWKTSHPMTVQVWVTSTVCRRRGESASHFFFAKWGLTAVELHATACCSGQSDFQKMSRLCRS